MSRCVLDNEDTGAEVVIGWDLGLNTFFGQVTQPGKEEPAIWLGLRPNEYLTPDVPLNAILPYACRCSEKVLRFNLLQDQRNNDERIYSIDGETVW